ncbi:MAG: hypothetical protein QXG86_01310 [Candidatus Woesearchaeota archaeon]
MSNERNKIFAGMIIFFLLSLVFLSGCVKKSTEKTEIRKVQDNSLSKEKDETLNENKILEDKSVIKCYSDEDCGGRILVGQPYCFQGNPQGTVEINKCINPGKTDSYCISETKTGILQECSENQFCKQGECINYDNCQDSDGGLNFKVAGRVLQNDGAVFEDYCKSSNILIEYYCSSDNRAFSKQYSCDCSKGACE